MLGSRPEKKLPCGPAVAAYQGQNRRPPAPLWSPTEGQKVACGLLPGHSPLRAAKAPQIVKSPQNRMPTAKPSKHCHQPAGNQPWGYLTVRIHRHHGAPKAPLAHLPISKTKQNRPNHRTHGVLKVGNQLDRQQRKSQPAPSAHKTRNRNPLLLEARKQLNRIPPVRANLPIAINTTTDRTHRSNLGNEINPAGQKRFCVLPNRLESVNVGKLNLRLPCSPGGRSFGCVNLLACLLGGLGYFSKVNSLPRYSDRCYIIGPNTLQIQPPSTITISG